MVKKELVDMIAEKSGLTKKNSEIALNAFVASVEEALTNGESVKLSGFGSFEVRETAERNSRNPKTGEAIVVPAGKKPVFKMSKTLKTLVKG